MEVMAALKALIPTLFTRFPLERHQGPLGGMICSLKVLLSTALVMVERLT